MNAFLAVSLLLVQGGAASRPAPPNPHTVAAPWISDAMQIRDAAKRAAAIESIRAALSGSDAVARHAALIALASIGDVAFDKRSFREPVLACVNEPAGELRRDALYALFNTAPEPGDLDRVIAMASDPPPALRDSLTHLLHLFAKGDLTGRAGDAALHLLATDEPRPRREAMRGIWGARVSKTIEARLLDLSRADDREVRHDAIYFGLSTLQEKSAAVVERLIDVLADPDPNNSQRALWGIGHGVAADQHARVAAAVVQFFDARSNPSAQRDCLRIVGNYGGAAQIEWLEGIAKGAQASSSLAADATNALRLVRARATK